MLAGECRGAKSDALAGDDVGREAFRERELSRFGPWIALADAGSLVERFVPFLRDDERFPLAASYGENVASKIIDVQPSRDSVAERPNDWRGRRRDRDPASHRLQQQQHTRSV